MQTKRILKVVAALLALILFHLTLTRIESFRKEAEMAARERRAELSAEAALGIHPQRYTLPGGMTL